MFILANCYPFELYGKLQERKLAPREIQARDLFEIRAFFRLPTEILTKLKIKRSFQTFFENDT